MTLLHQAAQKAVEALTEILGVEVMAPEGGREEVQEIHCIARAALASLESALHQQPEPVALPAFKGYTPDGPVGMALEWLRSALTCPTFQWDGDQREYARKSLDAAEAWLAELVDTAPPALQHQEEPREPVAPHTALLEQALSAMAEVQEQADSGSPDGTLIPDSDWRAFVDAHAELSMLWTAWRDSPGWEPLDDTTAAVPLGVLERGEGGAFRVHANMDALRAIYAMPPGEHMLYASPSTTRQQEVGSGWRPIESAPKDGTWIAAIGHLGQYTPDTLKWKDGHWWNGYDNYHHAPTHWTLLAAAPSTPEKAGGEKVHYWCNKCGYGGPVQVGHQRPNGTGECGYMAASAYPAAPSPIPHPLPAQANDGGEQ